jgi:hypothetical protein
MLTINLPRSTPSTGSHSVNKAQTAGRKKDWHRPSMPEPPLGTKSNTRRCGHTSNLNFQVVLEQLLQLLERLRRVLRCRHKREGIFIVSK